MTTTTFRFTTQAGLRARVLNIFEVPLSRTLFILLGLRVRP
jgi:hypothetical protein